MKKLLSLAGAFLLVCQLSSYAQQNKQVEYKSTLSNERSQTHANINNSIKKVAPQPVPTSTASTCMSINYPTVNTWTPTVYTAGSAGAGGFVSGPNQYGDLEKAMYFDASTSSFTMLYQVDVWFAVAYSTNQNKVVNMKIYDGSSGTPGASLGTASMTIGSIMSDVAGNYNSSFYFPAGISLPSSKKFFCSLDISNLDWTTSKDSLCIVSNKDGQTTPAAAWEKQSTNNWFQYSSASAWSQNVSLYIHPFLRNTPVVATYSYSSNSICAGESISYDATGSTTGGSTYWSFGTSSPTSATTTVANPSYLSAGTYTTYLFVFDECDALAVAGNTLTVKPTPTVTANTSTNTVCAGNAITFTGGGASTYTWTGGVTDGSPYTPSSSGAYTVSGTAANGCTNTAVANITVNNLPAVSANTTTNTVCAGQNVTLSGSGASTYSWTGSVTDGVAFAPANTDTYTVTGTDANGCQNTATVGVTVNSVPSVTANASSTAICSGDMVTLTGSGASTYSWTASVSDGVAFSPSATDTYTVTGTDANGCSSTAFVTVNVSTCTGIKLNSNDVTFNIYPNPNQGRFIVNINGVNETIKIEIYNNIGKLVHSEDILSTQTIYTNIAVGIYYVKLVKEGRVLAVNKFVKQ